MRKRLHPAIHGACRNNHKPSRISDTVHAVFPTGKQTGSQTPGFQAGCMKKPRISQEAAMLKAIGTIARENTQDRSSRKPGGKEYQAAVPDRSGGQGIYIPYLLTARIRLLPHSRVITLDAGKNVLCRRNPDLKHACRSQACD